MKSLAEMVRKRGEGMHKKLETQNYKKFQHRKCEFFPCHKGVPDEDFNCLFCYCPLYLLKDKCGGNFSYAHGIKDCSGCTKPHDKDSFDFIMSKVHLLMEGGKLDKKEDTDKKEKKEHSEEDEPKKDDPKNQRE